MTSKERRHQVDSGYSWVVLFGVFVVTFFHLGIVKVFGVFVPEVVEQLGLSMWSVGVSCSVGISLNALLGTVGISGEGEVDNGNDHPWPSTFSL